MSYYERRIERVCGTGTNFWRDTKTKGRLEQSKERSGSSASLLNLGSVRSQLAARGEEILGRGRKAFLFWMHGEFGWLV
jgi:hypothetical protein